MWLHLPSTPSRPVGNGVVRAYKRVRTHPRNDVAGNPQYCPPAVSVFYFFRLDIGFALCHNGSSGLAQTARNQGGDQRQKERKLGHISDGGTLV